MHSIGPWIAELSRFLQNPRGRDSTSLRNNPSPSLAAYWASHWACYLKLRWPRGSPRGAGQRRPCLPLTMGREEVDTPTRLTHSVVYSLFFSSRVVAGFACRHSHPEQAPYFMRPFALLIFVAFASVVCSVSARCQTVRLQTRDT